MSMFARTSDPVPRGTPKRTASLSLDFRAKDLDGSKKDPCCKLLKSPLPCSHPLSGRYRVSCVSVYDSRKVKGVSAQNTLSQGPAGPAGRRLEVGKSPTEVTMHWPVQPNPQPDNQRRGQGTRLGPAPRAPRCLLHPRAVDGQGDQDRVGRCAPHPPSRARSGPAHM